MTPRPAVPSQRDALRQNRRIVLLVVLLVVMLVLSVIGGHWFIGWPKIGPATVTNKSGAISLDVPTGWIATTPWNSPRTVWPLVGGPSRVAWPTIGGPDRVEDIRVVAEASGSGTAITIYLDIAPDNIELAEMHARDLGADFKKDAVAVNSPVRDRHPSLASVNRRSGNVQEIVTLRSLHYVVTAVVSAPNETGLQAANDALATLTVRDDK